jgi:hypothetical protein
LEFLIQAQGALRPEHVGYEVNEADELALSCRASDEALRLAFDVHECAVAADADDAAQVALRVAVNCEAGIDEG